MSVKCRCEQSLSMFRRTRPMNSESFIQLLSETSRMLVFFYASNQLIRGCGLQCASSSRGWTLFVRWQNRGETQLGWKDQRWARFYGNTPRDVQTTHPGFWMTTCRKTPLYSDFLDCRKVSKSLDLLISLQSTRIYSFPRHGLMTGSKVDMFWRFFFGTFAGRHDDARACLCTGEACR